MDGRVDLTLLNLFYFNSCYGPQEGEEEKKVLFYYPDETELDTKIRNVGLAEAIIKFTDTFNPNKPCQSLHTQRTRQIFHQAEPGFWSVMTLSVPTITKQRDGQEHVEYLNDDLSDATYLAVLQQSHQMFQLFNGQLEKIAENPSLIKVQLEQFYSRMIPMLKLTHSDLLDIFSGMQFLPLDANNFLHVQCLVNKVEANFPTVKHSAVLFNDQLVWSGVDPSDMQLIFSYLVTTLLPSFLETELTDSTRPQFIGQYITGPSSNIRNDLSPNPIPKLHLSSGETVYLVVYKAMNATICLLLDSYSVPTKEFFQRFNTFMSSRLVQVSEELAKSYTKSVQAAAQTAVVPISGDTPKFIYFNSLNRATKSTVHLDSRKCGNVSVTPELLRLLADVYVDKESLDSCSEVILKTRNDSWVAAKFANLREFYVVLNTKNANLIEISDELTKMCDVYLNCIFFAD